MDLNRCAPNEHLEARLPKTLQNDAYRAMIERLKAARLKAGITQQVLADALGLPQSYVAKVERFERRLDVIELIDLALEIGTDPVKLVREATKARR
ncbi:MAG: helix-turn-helix transcriptional regulator [Pseudomonadota bacterium]